MPKFVSIPNFDSLSPQTTKGDLVGRTTVGATRIPVGSDNTVLTADSTQALGVKWASAVANLPVNALTGATTLPATSQVVLISGTTFAITFPSASGNSGLQYVILKTDSISTAISIVGSNGVKNVTLSTIREEYQYFCDGATYWPVNHYSKTAWATFTPAFFALGTVTNVWYEWSRDGEDILVRGAHNNGTIGSSLTTLSLPSPLTLDSSKSPLGTTTTQAGWAIGRWTGSAGSSDDVPVLAYPGYTTTLVYFGAGPASASKLIAQQASAFSASGASVSVMFRHPITGWSE